MSDQNKHLRALELPKVLAMLAEQASCADTKALAEALRPAATFEEARRQLALTVDAHSLTNRFGTPSIYGVVGVSDLVARARVGAALSLRELLHAASLLRGARSLLHWKRQAGDAATALDNLFYLLYENKYLEEDITQSILSEDEIADNASAELADIRRKIRGAHQKARDILDRMIRSTTTQKYLQEQIITIRNGRFVVPVKNEYRGEIKGLTHDTSSSGATLFVEPMAVVEQNNLIRELESKQQHEIDRILLAFSGRIGEIADELLGSYDAILQLDLAFAKSRLADRMHATVPLLVERGETHLKRARHPLINRDVIVPIDIRLGGEFDTLVITGPNTGGKTVALKTLGLLTMMASCGLMLPVADESRVCFYQDVLADIGDEQSIEQSLSTFSAHMHNIISILGAAGPRSLVLIDELGAGTDPVEGAALAVAIISRLRAMGAKIAATTHYAEIKVYALQTDGVENASCEFDVATLRPTYRLLIGTPGRSNAFAISERLGLPGDVIDVARAQISHENARFEDVVNSLETARQELEAERRSAQADRREAKRLLDEAAAQRERLEADREKELQRARDQARSLVEQVKFQSNQLLDELEALKKQKDKADFSATVSDVKSTFKSYVRDLENQADPIAKQRRPDNYRLPRALREGDTVLLTDLGSQGVVLAPADGAGYVQVQAGILKTKVKATALRLVEDQKTTFGGGSVSAKGAVSSAKSAAKAEVDLRGMTSDEALLELDQYLDTAVLSGIPTVTIIHGKGTGALRKAVQQRLRSHRSVKTFRAGAYGEGEAGVTIAELK